MIHRFLVLAFALCLGVPIALGQGTLVRKPVTEILEYFTKKSGTQGLKELEQIGGERAVREVVEKAVAEGGEAAGEQVARAVSKHGVSALEAIKAEPAAMLKALGKMPDDIAAKAVAEASRSPQAIGRLVKTYGDDALLVSSKHPGVGAQAVERFGEAGLHAGKTLNTAEMIVLKRAQGYETLTKAEKDLFARLFERNPRQFYNALLVAGGGATIYLTTRTLNDVSHALVGTAEKPGALVTTLETGFRWTAIILLTALTAYIAIKLHRTWRTTRNSTYPDAGKSLS